MAKSRGSKEEELDEAAEASTPDAPDVPDEASLDDLLASVGASIAGREPEPESEPACESEPASKGKVNTLDAAASRYKDPGVADVNEWRLSSNERKKLAERLSPGNLSKSLQSLQTAVAASVSGAYGMSEKEVIYGVRVPLVWEYLTGNTVMPCGSYIHLSGTTNVGKSTLGAEFMRWFCEANGLPYLIETENKYNPTHFANILGKHFKRVVVTRCQSANEWTRNVSRLTRALGDILVDKSSDLGIGFNVPVVIVVDNVASANVEAELEKFDKDGDLSTQQAMRLAGMMKPFCMTIPGMVANTPFLLVALNHLTVSQTLQGIPLHKSPGGNALQQFSAMSFRMEPDKLTVMNTAEFDIKRIRLKCYKNSFGQVDRKINLRLLTNIVNPGEDGRKTKFDWDWSLIDAMSKLESKEKSALAAAGIHLAVTKSSDVQNAAWSRSLGMSADDAIPWAELGRRFQTNPKFVAAFRTALDITARPVIDPTEYLKKLQAAGKKASNE